MNDKMMEVFTRSIVASLPKKRKRVYQFIEKLEDQLAQQSKTKEHFLTLLKEHSPHHQAASRFHLTIDETVRLMHDIEDEISEKLEMKLQKYKWIDYTEKVNEIQDDHSNKKQYYLVIT